jgi:hypothetical protein
MKRKAQILIVQQFLLFVENLVGIDECFKVFAQFLYYAEQFFHPTVEMIVVYIHDTFVF